jgi:capsular exopolysaccharide synthesis family protein
VITAGAPILLQALRLYRGWKTRVLVYVAVFVLSVGTALVLDLHYGVPQGSVVVYVMGLIIVLIITVPIAAIWSQRVQRWAYQQNRPFTFKASAVGRSIARTFPSAGAFWLYRKFQSNRFTSADDVENKLDLPLLGAIPETTARLAHLEPRSLIAEAYRNVRTSLLVATAGRPPRTILVTSSQLSEGATTTALNTAISLAQTGAKVLIIDADMRRPRLRSIFGLTDRPGLSSILSSNVTEAAMLEMISKDEVTGLNVLTSGPIPPNPAELLCSDQMRRLIATLQSEFTHVVVDSPPISSFTDGVLIATMVDGVLLVVHGGKSSRHVVRRSRQLLLEVGAKIFGVVLIRSGKTGSGKDYYRQYYPAEFGADGMQDEENLNIPDKDPFYSHR